MFAHAHSFKFEPLYKLDLRHIYFYTLAAPEPNILQHNISAHLMLHEQNKLRIQKERFLQLQSGVMISFVERVDLRYILLMKLSIFSVKVWKSILDDGVGRLMSYL